ncbi:MAG: PaaI family thioesterase [Pararhodobacter sp.]
MMTPSNPNFHTSVATFLESMPIAAFYGIDLLDVEPGYCALVLPFRPELSHNGSAFQASATGALADFAGGLAVVTLLPEGDGVATVGYELHLLTPANGEQLVARGRTVRVGRTASLAQTDVFVRRGSIETHCATAFISLRTISLSSRQKSL